jgi:hypothetical protein
MPRPSHRVDLLFVPDDLAVVPDAHAFAALQSAWRAEGLLGPGAAVDGLVLGGFQRLWLDLPGRLTLYANQQGGYYVRCPVRGDNIVPAFSSAVSAWRAGGAFSLSCPACGDDHPLNTVTLSPPGVFGWGAVVFSDVGSLSLADGVRDSLARVLGESHEVIRRVG